MKSLIGYFSSSLLLALSLGSQSSFAALYNCEIDGNSVVRTAQGKDLNLRLSGEHTCYGEPQPMQLTINGKTENVPHRLVGTNDGKLYWVASQAATIGEVLPSFGKPPVTSGTVTAITAPVVGSPIVGSPVVAPDGRVTVTVMAASPATTPAQVTPTTPAATSVQSAVSAIESAAPSVQPVTAAVAPLRFDRGASQQIPNLIVENLPETPALAPSTEVKTQTPLLSDSYFSKPIAMPNVQESLVNFNIEKGFRLRSSPKIASNNIVGGTLGPQDGLKLVYENGTLASEDGFVKAKTASGAQVWVHESALSLSYSGQDHLLNQHPQRAALAVSQSVFNGDSSLQQRVAELRAGVTPKVEDRASAIEIQRAEQKLLREQQAARRRTQKATPSITAPTITAPIVTAALTPQTEDAPTSVVPNTPATIIPNAQTTLEATGGVSPQDIYAQLGITDVENPVLRQQVDQAAVAAVNQPFPTARPTNLKEIRAKFAESKTDEGFGLVPSKNWGTVTAQNLNLRNAPGTKGTSVIGKMTQGGRVAVLESKEVEGRRWHKVIPFDCQTVIAEGGDPNMVSEDPCNAVYWVAGSNIGVAAAPTLAEIQARPAPQEFTEAGACANCIGIAAINSTIEDLSEEIQDAVEETNASLFEEYLEFQKGFLQRHPIPKGWGVDKWARTNKALFIEEMIQKMGLKKANDAVLVLTAFGEARGSGHGRNKTMWDNMAEMSTVMTVIDNRAKTNYYTQTSLVNDYSPASAQMRAALHPNQFSVWNTGDTNLATMMVTGSSVVRQHGDLQSLSRAFETLQMMESGDIQPMGRLASVKTRHYHSRNMLKGLVAWARGQRHIATPQVMTPDGPKVITSHIIYEDIR